MTKQTLNNMAREQFRGPKWSYFVNFRCTGRSGPLSGARALRLQPHQPKPHQLKPQGPGPFSLTSLMDDPALLATEVYVRQFGQTDCVLVNHCTFRHAKCHLCFNFVFHLYRRFQIQ